MDDKTDKPVAIRCKANGCPMRWEFATYFHEPDNKRDKRVPRGGVCRFHRAAPADQWTATTRRIIEVYPYLRIVEAVQSIGDSHYQPRAGDTVGQWVQRLQNMAMTHIHPEPELVTEPAAESLKQIQQML